MKDYEFKQTTYGEAMEKAFEDMQKDSNGENGLSDEVKNIIRSSFVKAMHQTISRRTQSEKNVTISSKIDFAEEFPFYQVSDDCAEIYLKDADITTETQFGKEKYQAEYVKLNIHGYNEDDVYDGAEIT